MCIRDSQPGDPNRLAKVLVDFVSAPNPPVRLPLGSDTAAATEAVAAAHLAVLKDWRAVAVSTDFPAEGAAAYGPTRRTRIWLTWLAS